MNFVTIRENITPQQAFYLLNKLEEMAKTQEVGAFCGNRILYIDCVRGEVKYSFINRTALGNKSEENISRHEALQLMLHQAAKNNGLSIHGLSFADSNYT